MNLECKICGMSFAVLFAHIYTTVEEDESKFTTARISLAFVEFRISSSGDVTIIDCIYYDFLAKL